MAELIELKKCPFCGENVEWREYEYVNGSICPRIEGHYWDCICYAEFEVDDYDFTEEDDDGNMIINLEEKTRLMNKLAEKWNERCDDE